MAARTEKGLTAVQLLQQVFMKLCAEWPSRRLALQVPAGVLIADDSDYHRTAQGFMVYRELYLLTLPSYRWVLGNGMKGGKYPGDNFVADILARKLWPSLDVSNLPKLIKEVESWEYFTASLVVALRGGDVAAAGGKERERRIGRRLPNGFQGLVARSEKVDRSVVTMSLSPVYSGDRLYKPEAVDALFKVLEATMIEEDSL